MPDQLSIFSIDDKTVVVCFMATDGEEDVTRRSDAGLVDGEHRRFKAGNGLEGLPWPDRSGVILGVHSADRNKAGKGKIPETHCSVLFKLMGS